MNLADRLLFRHDAPGVGPILLGSSCSDLFQRQSRLGQCYLEGKFALIP